MRREGRWRTNRIVQILTCEKRRECHWPGTKCTGCELSQAKWCEKSHQPRNYDKQEKIQRFKGQGFICGIDVLMKAWNGHFCYNIHAEVGSLLWIFECTYLPKVSCADLLAQEFLVILIFRCFHASPLAQYPPSPGSDLRLLPSTHYLPSSYLPTGFGWGLDCVTGALVRKLPPTATPGATPPSLPNYPDETFWLRVARVRRVPTPNWVDA